MKTAKIVRKFIACLLGATLIWGSVPWSSFAATNDSFSPRTNLSGNTYAVLPMTQWTSQHWDQLANAVNLALFHGGNERALYLRPAALVTHLAPMMSDGNNNAAVAAFILGSAKNPAAFKSIIQKLKETASDTDTPRMQAANKLEALGRKNVSDSAQYELEVAANLHELDIPGSFEGIFDGNRKHQSGLGDTPETVSPSNAMREDGLHKHRLTSAGSTRPGSHESLPPLPLITREPPPGRNGQASSGDLSGGFWTFFKSALFHQYGSWTGSVLVPIVIMSVAGPTLALVCQGIMLVFLLAGIKWGAHRAKENESLRKIFIYAQDATSVAIFVTILAQYFGAAHPTLFAWTCITARALTGFFGAGAVNFASQEIVPRITGGDAALNKLGNGLYSLAVKLMAVLGSASVPLAFYFLPKHGGTVAGAIAVIALVLSKFFMRRVTFAEQTSKPVENQQNPVVKKEAVTAGHKSSLGFAIFNDQGFFAFYGPFLGMLVFTTFNKEMQGYLVTFFSLGGLLSSAAFSFPKYVPSVFKRLLERDKVWWLRGSVLSWILFFAANLGLHQRIAALASAFLLGYMIAGAAVQWKSFMQDNLDKENRIKIFKRISYIATTLLIGIFAIFRVYPILRDHGVPLPDLSLLKLLTLSFWVITAAGIKAVVQTWFAKPTSKHSSESK